MGQIRTVKAPIMIGYLREDGCYIAGWQHEAEVSLGDFLRQEYDSLEKVKELVAMQIWDTLIQPRDKKRLAEYRAKCQDERLVKVGCAYLWLDDETEDKPRPVNHIAIVGGALKYKNLLDARAEDADYLYVFNAVTNKWKTIGARLSYSRLQYLLKDVRPTNVCRVIDNLV